MKENLYHYKALITEVESVDTCYAYLDLGFGIVLTGTTLKLNRIAAPKVKGSKSQKTLEGKKFLASLVVDQDVTVETIKTKGAFLAELWVYDNTKKRINVNDLLVEQGLATYKK
ncbi:MAG TPA: thermonuclease family protein [Bacteroidota bacterium]|nr:thermonuclease family protein [Bacteroidota bacterium]